MTSEIFSMIKAPHTFKNKPGAQIHILQCPYLIRPPFIKGPVIRDTLPYKQSYGVGKSLIIKPPSKRRVLKVACM